MCSWPCGPRRGKRRGIRRGRRTRRCMNARILNLLFARCARRYTRQCAVKDSTCGITAHRMAYFMKVSTGTLLFLLLQRASAGSRRSIRSDGNGPGWQQVLSVNRLQPSPSLTDLLASAPCGLLQLEEFQTQVELPNSLIIMPHFPYNYAALSCDCQGLENGRFTQRCSSYNCNAAHFVETTQ